MERIRVEHDITVILPAYNEGLLLEKNFELIDQTLKDDGFLAQYIIVDDGSKDFTWEAIESLTKGNRRVKGIRFAKNFGKEIALAAGVDAAKTSYVVIMDSDLQHPPECIRPMYDQLLESGSDVILGKKSDRGSESMTHRFLAKSFYTQLKRLTGLDMQNSSDFMIMTKPVVEEIQNFSERHLFFRGIVDWVGFDKTIYYFDVKERADGTKSRFSTMGLIKLALDAIISYTSKPLYLVVICGVLFSIFSVVLGIQTMINYTVGRAMSGFSTVILLLLIIGSVIMLSLGIIGIYLSRIYEEIKARPRYIVKETIGRNDEWMHSQRPSSKS